MPSQTRADAPAARSPTVRACLLVTVALLPVCLGRKCGQAEIETKTIEGCTSFEHVRLLGSSAPSIASIVRTINRNELLIRNCSVLTKNTPS